MRPTISSVFNVATFEPIPFRSYSTGNIDKLLESDNDEDKMRRASIDSIVREPNVKPTDSPYLATSVDHPNPQKMTKSEKKRRKKKNTAATTNSSSLEANQLANTTMEADGMTKEQNIAVAPTNISPPKTPSITEVLPSPQSASDHGLSVRAKNILVENRMKELTKQGNSNSVLKDAAPKFQQKNMAKKKSRKPSDHELRVNELLKSANIIPSRKDVKLYKSIDEIPKHTGGKIPVQLMYDSAKQTLIARWSEYSIAQLKISYVYGLTTSSRPGPGGRGNHEGGWVVVGTGVSSSRLQCI
jgi:hypothetical protein